MLVSCLPARRELALAAPSVPAFSKLLQGYAAQPPQSQLDHPFWKLLEGKADPEHRARPALAKVANSQGLTWQESCDADMSLMSKIDDLGELAIKNGHI